MIEYSKVEDGDAPLGKDQLLHNVPAPVIAYPLKIAIWHLLRHGSAIEDVGVHFFYTRSAAQGHRASPSAVVSAA